MVATRALSPDALTRVTLAAPRMRRNSTSQRAYLSSRPWLTALLDHHQLVAASAITLLVLGGTGVAYITNSAFDTSNPFINSPPLTTNFLRTKDNFLNQVFVKRAWGWTVSCVLSQLILVSSTPTRTRQRLLALALASVLWYGFTAWFFGAGIGDRIIAATGGICAVPAPLDLEHEFQHGLLTSLGSPDPLNWPSTIPAGYVPVAPHFCNARTPLTPLTHPLLFTASKLHKLTPRWTRGLDISGHVWLLTLASMRLAAEVAEGIRGIVMGHAESSVTAKISTLYTASVLALWTFMLFITSIYFHKESEKLVALGLGLAASLLVDRAASLLQTPIPLQNQGMDMNENAARRRMASQ